MSSFTIPKDFVNGRLWLLVALVPLTFLGAVVARWPFRDAAAVAFSPDGKTLAVAMTAPSRNTGRIVLWDVDSRKPTRVLTSVSSVMTLAYPDGETLIAATRDGEIQVWNPLTGKLTRRWKAHSAEIRAIDYDRHTGRLFTGSVDGEIACWDAATGRLQFELAIDRYLESISLSPDGSKLAIGLPLVDKVEVFDVATVEPRLLTSLTAGGRVVEYSPKSERIAAWRVGAGAVLDGPRRIFLKAPLGQFFARSAAFSPNGALLAAAGDSRQGQIRVWDPTTGAVIRDFKSDTQMIWEVEFSPDGKQLAGGGLDGATYLFDANSGAISAKLVERDPFAALTGLLIVTSVIWVVLWLRQGVRRPTKWNAIGDFLLLNGLAVAFLGTRSASGEDWDLQQPHMFLLIGVLSGLAGVLLSWFVLGGGRWSVRLPILLVGLAGLWFVAGNSWDDSLAMDIISCGVVLLAVSFVLLGVARKCGATIGHCDSSLAIQVERPSEARQVHLRDLLLIMAACGFLVGVARISMPDFWVGRINWQVMLIYVTEGFSIASLLASSIWATMYVGVSWVMRGAIPMLVIVAITFFAQLISGLSNLPWSFYLAMYASISACTVASAGLLRLYGYRLHFAGRNADVESSPFAVSARSSVNADESTTAAAPRH